MSAKKYNKGRKQKPNYSRRHMDNYMEEIGKELGTADNKTPPAKMDRRPQTKREY